MVPIWHELYRDGYSIETLARNGRAAAQAREASGTALQAISRLAHAGCKRRRSRGHGVQRPAVLAASRAARRAAPVPTPLPRKCCCCWPRNPRRRDAGASRITTWASSSLARSTSACSSTSRLPRSGGRAIAHVDRTQDDRQLLHAALDHRVPGQANARAAGRGQDAPTTSSRCACSIRQWAAAPFSWRPAGILPINARRATSRTGAGRAGDVTAADRAALRAAGRRAMPVRRRPQSDSGATRAAVAVADHAGRRPAADVSRSSPRGRQQPGRRAAGRSGAADRRGRDTAPRCRCSTIRSPEIGGASRAAGAAAHRARRRRIRSIGRANKERLLAALVGSRWPSRRWSAAADAWCAAALSAPPASVRGSRRGMDRGRDRIADDAARRRSSPHRSSALARIAAQPRRVPLGARVSGSVLRRRRPAAIPMAGSTR